MNQLSQTLSPPTSTQRKLGDGLAALLMLVFSVPKLIGAERSVAGFRDIGAFLGVDPLVPRLFTGTVEMVIAALLVASFVAPALWRQRVTLSAHALLLSTMFGAIMTELVVRPGAANGLLALAIVLAIFATMRLRHLWDERSTSKPASAPSAPAVA